VGEDAIAVLQAQEWPGNARQLRNSIERLLILMKGQQPDDGVITAPMLPSDIGEVLPTVGDTDASAHLMSLPLRDAREVFERQYLLAQIERFGGNISKHRRVRRHGAQRPPPQDQVPRIDLTGGAVLKIRTGPCHCGRPALPGAGRQ
jgi:DNA-binding NtrC family response regulator